MTSSPRLRYTPFIRNAFLTMLAYRLRYYTGILTYFLFVSVHYFIWQAVFAGREGPINGFTFPQMITYIAVGWVSRSSYFSDIDEEMDDLVRTGQISIYLLRPVNFQVMLLMQAFGASLFRATCFSLPLGLLIVLVFPVEPPPSILAFLLFVLSSFGAFLVLAELNFLVGLWAFSLKSIQGVMRTKYYLIQLFSGLLLPLTFFPGWIQTVLNFLPFKMIAYVPLQFYLGKIEGTRILAVLGQELFWVAALFLLGRTLWHRALERLTVQGG